MEGFSVFDISPFARFQRAQFALYYALQWLKMAAWFFTQVNAENLKFYG